MSDKTYNKSCVNPRKTEFIDFFFLTYPLTGSSSSFLLVQVSIRWQIKHNKWFNCWRSEKKQRICGTRMRSRRQETMLHGETTCDWDECQQDHRLVWHRKIFKMGIRNGDETMKIFYSWSNKWAEKVRERIRKTRWYRDIFIGDGMLRYPLLSSLSECFINFKMYLFNDTCFIAS